MKARNLLLALGCAAAFTACTNNEIPVVAPAMRTVTMSVEVDEPATTRVEYTYDSIKDVYKFAWSEGDKLSVYYYDETSSGSIGQTEFSIGEIAANGKQATFTGSLPEEVDKVLIVYTSKGITKYESGFCDVGFPGTTVTNDTSVANALTQNTFLYAYAEVESSGKLPNVKLQHGLAYLLLEKGLKMINNETDISISSIQASTDCSCIAFDLDEIWSYYIDGIDRLSIYFDENGCLTDNYLIPFKPETNATQLNFTYENYETYGDAFEPNYTYQPGVIYKVAAGNTKWVPIDVDDGSNDDDWDDDDWDEDDDD